MNLVEQSYNQIVFILDPENISRNIAKQQNHFQFH